MGDVFHPNVRRGYEDRENRSDATFCRPSTDVNLSAEAIQVSLPQIYLVGQEAPRSADYVCDMCGTRQTFQKGDTLGRCRVCSWHVNAWTLAEDIERQRSTG